MRKAPMCLVREDKSPEEIIGRKEVYSIFAFCSTCLIACPVSLYVHQMFETA